MATPTTGASGALALAAQLEARALSCRDLMQQQLARIHQLNPRFNAIVSLRDETALLREADERDAELARGQRRGWLHGFPLAIKDLAATAGLVSTEGSPLNAAQVPAHDSITVERLKNAGAIVIGKTNVPEFGLGSHTYNPVFGTTLNAYDPTRSAGGSSGGAAVSLALGLQPVADGSDMMGSLRNPAAWNNVFGLRPSEGRVPSGPAGDGFVATVATDGPMATTVADLAALFGVMAGHDPRAPRSLDGKVVGSDATTRSDLAGCRVGWLGDLAGHLAMEAGVISACEAGLQRLQGLGAAVEPLAFGFAPERVWASWCTWRHWLVAGKLKAHFDHRPDALKPEARWECERGAALSAADVYAASLERSAFYRHLLGLFERFDVLALPSAQCWPFPAEWTWPRQIEGRTMDSYHRWMEVVIYASLAGVPAISVPTGFSVQGWPMGLQLIGRPRGEAALLRLAAAYETAIGDWLARRPAAVQAQADRDPG